MVRRQASLEDKLREIKDLPATTLDGQSVVLSGNIEKAGDSDAVKLFGAEGVGLFRTEYLFINRDSLPTEEEQYKSYRCVAAELKPAPVIIRTLDLGGDKFLSHLSILPGGEGSFSRATPRHFAGQRRGQRQDHVSDDFRLRRTGKGQCAGRGIQG
jgi:phosphoenolpyruvate-protein kinase (PTS system EI component)